MCGIIGCINHQQPVDRTPEIDSIAHRGPDGRGEWRSQDGKTWLGHTRLSILDLSPSGRQPMQDATGRWVITFNGEIYNHLSLRSLIPGHQWRGHSDTETLVELWARKGLEALPLLKGMFAFAVADTHTGELLLVRDRLGIKPLYCCQHANGMSFASEIRPLLLFTGQPWFHTAAMAEYIAYGRLPAGGELLAGISSLLPASWMRVKADGKIETGTWWQPGSQSYPLIHSRQEAIKLVQDQMASAVTDHLLSDVNVGVFLSGGLDSGIITMLASQHLGSRLGTFTIGFPDKAFDERTKAGLVAKKAGATHHEIHIQHEQCLQWVMDAIENMDAPSVDAINTYIVSRAVAEQGLKVALSGLGGDELFGGYPSFRQVPKLSLFAKLPDWLRQFALAGMPDSISLKLAGLPSYSLEDIAVSRRRFTPVSKLTEMGLPSGQPVLSKCSPVFDEMGCISWCEMQGYMIPMLLRDSDQMSMAVGLELRVPFLDHEFVETVLQIPQQFKKGDGSKPLLAEAFRHLLPPEILQAPKQGFELPMAQWLNGPLFSFAEKSIHQVAAQMQTEWPKRQWQAFKNGQVHWTRVWQWAILGHWASSHNISLRN